MKKLSLIVFSLITTLALKAQTTAQLTGILMPDETKNIISNGINSSTKFVLQNTGLSSLRFCLSGSPNSACLTSGVVVAPGATVSTTVADLGGTVQGTYLNVSNNVASTLKLLGGFAVLPNGLVPPLPNPTFDLCATSTPNWTVDIPNKSLYVCPTTTRVGIGTKLPMASLSIEAATGTSFLINQTTNVDYDYAQIIRVSNKNTKAFAIQNNGIEAVSILGDGSAQFTGNLSIGEVKNNQFSLYRLQVNGTIRAKEVVVETANWPDYVFKKDYKLKSIHDLSSYINENKHLPEIPSEQELVGSGVKVNEMLNLQMKKIEELTLYIIDLQKQLDLQKEQLKQLSSK